jgi:hypothetical protein
MLLQTNSYVVPRDRRMEHARILRRFRQILQRLGCDHFEVYEQVGPNWGSGETSGRFVQIMRFRDRKHQLAVQSAERADPGAQAILKEFCELINLPYQQQQGLFAVGYYTGFLRMTPSEQQAGVLTEEHAQAEGAASGEESAVAEGSSQTEESAEAEEIARAEGAIEESVDEARAEEPSQLEENQAEESPVTSSHEFSIPESTSDLSEPTETADSSEGASPAPELEIHEPMVSDDEAPPDPERVAEEGLTSADSNGEELNTEARNEISAEADGLDSESVFLGALDGDLDDPGSIRPLPSDEDAEADTEKPTSPFNS